MTLHTHVKKIVRLAGFALLGFTLFSCTYDYFEDETNFLVYVPQIKEGTIKNYYIAFHDESGNHILTRTVTLPLDLSDTRNDVVKEGILKFKMNPGNYRITSFADYTPDRLTTGEAFDNSFKGEIKCDPAAFHPHDEVLENDYEISSTNPRFLMTRATVYPIGHPQGKDPVLIDMNDSTFFKGRVDIDFKGLPSQVATIVVGYRGVGTMLYFSSFVGRYADLDRVLASYPASGGGGTISLSGNLLYPSAGCKTNTKSVPAAEQPLELDVYLYGSNGSMIGIFSFTDEDFRALADSKKPKDGNGNPVTSLVLYPRQTIKFTFQEFMVVSIDLQGWEDTTEGGLTPM